MNKDIVTKSRKNKYEKNGHPQLFEFCQYFHHSSYEDGNLTGAFLDCTHGFPTIDHQFEQCVAKILCDKVVTPDDACTNKHQLRKMIVCVEIQKYLG